MYAFFKKCISDIIKNCLSSRKITKFLVFFDFFKIHYIYCFIHKNYSICLIKYMISTTCIDMPYENVINLSNILMIQLLNLLMTQLSMWVIQPWTRLQSLLLLTQFIIIYSIWSPNETFLQIYYNKFQSNILSDTPCVCCERLLCKSKATWIVYDPTVTQWQAWWSYA